MLELLTDPQAWISLATLSVLEIVLGIDNIIFVDRLRAPARASAGARPAHRARARAAGAGAAASA